MGDLFGFLIIWLGGCWAGYFFCRARFHQAMAAHWSRMASRRTAGFRLSMSDVDDSLSQLRADMTAPPWRKIEQAEDLDEVLRRWLGPDGP